MYYVNSIKRLVQAAIHIESNIETRCRVVKNIYMCVSTNQKQQNNNIISVIKTNKVMHKH